MSRYAALVGALVLSGVLLAILALPLDAQGRLAVILGATLAGANTIGAYFLSVWSEGRPSGAFVRAVLGGMLLRMALLLSFVVAALLGLGLPRGPLVASLLTSFVIFLVLELALLSRRHPAPSVAR